MEGEILRKKTNSSVVPAILLILVILLGGFIVYDKLLKKTDTSECPKCASCEKTTTDYTNVSIDTKASLVCTIDMTGLTSVDVASKCGDSFDNTGEYQIRVNNLNYNGISYTYTYVLEKDTYFPREEDAGIVKMYIGSTLVSAHNGAARNLFRSLNVSGGNLHIIEGARTDESGFESDLVLSNIIK